MKIQTLYNIYDEGLRLRKNGIYNVDRTTAERLILEGRVFDPTGEVTAETLKPKPTPKPKAKKKSSDRKSVV